MQRKKNAVVTTTSYIIQESENKRLAYVITCSLATALPLQREFANTVYIVSTKLKVSGLGSE